MPTFDPERLMFCFQNRCSQGIYGGAQLSANVAHGDTLNNIFHPKLGRAAQLTGNDATISIELMDMFLDVQVIHIVTDITAEGSTIEFSSKLNPGDSYVSRKTLTLGTASADAGEFLTGGAKDTSFEERKDPITGLYTIYFSAAEQATVAGHPFWTIQIIDPGNTESIFVRALYMGPGQQFLTEQGDGIPITLTRSLVQGDFDNTLREIAFQTQGRTESEIAVLETHIARIGFDKPFFFSGYPNQGTITGATNHREKSLTMYGELRPPLTIESVPGAGGLVRLSGAIVESQ